MEKRTKIALLVLVGLLLFALGVWLFIQPILEQRAAQQPPSLTAGSPLIVGSGQPTPAPAQTPSSTSTQKVPLPVNAMNQLQNRAKSLVERLGSGSSQTGFLGYQDAEPDMTAAGRASILREQGTLQMAHPPKGSVYTLTTRAVSSVVKEGAIGDAKIFISVETIQTENAGLAGVQARPSAKRADIVFLKQGDGGYLAEQVTWSPIAL